MERAQKAHRSKAFLGVRACARSVVELAWAQYRHRGWQHAAFERPVLVLRKFNRESILVAPITSQLKRTPYHVRFTHDGIEYAIIISQVRLISTRRLRRRIFRMPEDRFGEVLSALQRMIGQGT